MMEDIHTLAIAAFVFDPSNDRFLDANGRFIELYGYSLDELKRMSIFELRPPEEKLASLKEAEDTRTDLIYQGESTHLKKNGEKISVVVFGRRFHHEGKERYLVKIKLK